MGLIIAFILMGFAVICKYKNGTWVNPSSIFCIEWFIISFLAAIRLYGLYEASIKTWMIIFLGSIIYLIGIEFGKKLKINNHLNWYSSINECGSFMKERTFWILVLILFILTLSDFFQTFTFWRAGYNLSEIREASVGMSTINSFDRNTGPLIEWISLAKSIIEILVVANAIECFVFDSKNNKSKIVVALSFELFNSFTTGGRFSLAYVILEIISCLMLYRAMLGNYTITISKKTVRWIRRIAVLMAVAIVVMTLLRGAEVNELLKKYYRYICGNVVFMDIHIKDLDSSGFWSCSFAGLYGFWSKILPIFHGLGFDYPQTYLNTISQVMDTQTFIKIADKMPTNAFITPFYHIYADFRFFGVIIGMFVFGAFSGCRYATAIKTNNRAQVVFYLITIQMIFKTLQNYPLTSSIYVFFIIFILFYNNLLPHKNT